MLSNEVANILNSQIKQTPTRDNSNELDKDAFLLLLIEQISNQDPLDPMGNEEFMGQLAQFSALEQQMNLNSSFEKFMSFQQLTQASTLIGKHVICLINTEDGLVSVNGVVEQVMMIDGTAYLRLSDESEVALGTVVSVQQTDTSVSADLDGGDS